MEHRDAEVSDIVVILKQECADKHQETVQTLITLGMTVEQFDADNGAVEGTVGADKVAQIRSLPCVSYVRVEFTYVAEFPTGDPRDLDPPAASGDSDE